MITWNKFAEIQPMLAREGERLIFQFGVGLAFLATIRKDGAPRLHPVCPILSDGKLFVRLLPESPKRWDLTRDGRFALQSFPEARPDSDEFYISGAARLIDNPRIIEKVNKDTQHAASDDEILFELLIDRAMYTRWEGFGTTDYHPIHTKWKNINVKYESLSQTKPPTWTIRKASHADGDTIASITDAAYSKYIPLIGRKPQPMTADYKKMADEHQIWLLCLDSLPVGVLVLMYEPDGVLIYNVAVCPKHQKRGMGRFLLSWAEQQTREAGFKILRLYTNALMESNIRLYHSLGYHETGREPYLGSIIVHMAKNF